MTVLVVVLAVLLVLSVGYLLVANAQITSVRRQLELQALEGSHRVVTLSLVVPPLEALVARLNDTVRRAKAASTQTQLEERRIRSFIADISHDLRTPLTSVRGYLQLLERSDLDADQRRNLGIAQRQASELGALIDRLYEYAYLLAVDEAPNHEPVDAGVLVGDCLLGMTGEIEGAGLDVRADLPSGLVLNTDREALTRIVQNLTRNAVQHGRDRLDVTVLRAPGGVNIRVANGVPPGAHIDTSQLFDRFFTADRARSGRTSGLGLSIVQVLVERLGGTIDARHDTTSSTLRFEVSIPDGPVPSAGGSGA